VRRTITRPARGGSVRVVARRDTIWVWDPDPSVYVTRERDRATGRQWFRLWMGDTVLVTMATLDTDVLVKAMADLRLDPGQTARAHRR
jgi:hypothetical protein